jgi:hypothetical protein
VIGKVGDAGGADCVVEPVVEGKVDGEVQSDLLSGATGEYLVTVGVARRSAMWSKQATNRFRQVRSTWGLATGGSMSARASGWLVRTSAER